MAAQNRPSLARKDTRTAKGKRDAALDEGVRLIVDGEVYEVRAGDLNALESRELRRQVGMTFPQLVDDLDRAPDIDLIAALMWLARRLRGERDVTFEDVASEVGYDVMEDIEIDRPGAEDLEEAAADPEG